jgi:hypothetical protein
MAKLGGFDQLASIAVVALFDHFALLGVFAQSGEFLGLILF